jgi:hypothetical protein
VFVCADKGHGPRAALHVKKQNILRRQTTRMLPACCGYARCTHVARMLHACCIYDGRMLLPYCPHVACYKIRCGAPSCKSMRRTSRSKQSVCQTNATPRNQSMARTTLTSRTSNQGLQRRRRQQVLLQQLFQTTTTFTRQPTSINRQTDIKDAAKIKRKRGAQDRPATAS